MKVRNMTSSSGNKVANQFIIITRESVNIGNGEFEDVLVTYFQSYEIIIVRQVHHWKVKLQLDRKTWDYSTTTGRYRNQFLSETKRETQKKIDSGEYILVDLNNDS